MSCPRYRRISSGGHQQKAHKDRQAVILPVCIIYNVNGLSSEGMKMRICERCKTQMTEGYSAGSNGLRITKEGFRNQAPVAELKCAVCPKCGKVEFYIDDPVKLELIAEKKDQ